MLKQYLNNDTRMNIIYVFKPLNLSVAEDQLIQPKIISSKYILLYEKIIITR